MPNRLPPCSLCGGRKRHLPENCPEIRKISDLPAEGIQGIPNGILALISALRTTRTAIDAVLEQFGENC
jgi:hypothetical protein